MIKKIIKYALDEDLKHIGDITSKAIFNSEENVFVLFSKEYGILCGSEIFRQVYESINKNIKIKFYFNDGDKISKGAKIAEISGRTAFILQGERTALNFISHLSGIASKTNQFAQKAGSKTKILDTRKTIPGLRELQKYAVKCGGGTNHRIGLYDMIMIKDNHIDGVGSITEAVKRIRKKWKHKYKIEVETRNLKEVKEALNCNVDIIMLDNMNIETMKKAVNIINKKAFVEASGNITLDRVEEASNTGVDFISVGELTHTVKAFDFSLVKQNLK